MIDKRYGEQQRDGKTIIKQALRSSRDEAVRAGDAVRKKLDAFEGTLGRVSQDTRAVLERKEAELRQVEAAREADRAAHRSGLERKEAVLRRLRAERESEQEANGKREERRLRPFAPCTVCREMRSGVWYLLRATAKRTRLLKGSECLRCFETSSRV